VTFLGFPKDSLAWREQGALNPLLTQRVGIKATSYCGKGDGKGLLVTVNCQTLLAT
jgi:hypothetical protein